VENSGERWGNTPYRSWVLDEFGIYTYTEIVSVGNAEIRGAPGDRYSTNGSSWYNSNFDSGNSGNVTVCTRSNGNYSMTVNVSDLLHSAVLSGAIGDDPLLHLDNTTIWVRGGNRTTSLNFSDNGRSVIWLYGFGSSNGSVDDNTKWQSHEPNGTCKYTGENASDTGLVEQYPDEYDENNFNSLNPESFSVEFACDIPSGQLAGKYSTHVYYHLRTQRHPLWLIWCYGAVFFQHSDLYVIFFFLHFKKLFTGHMGRSQGRIDNYILLLRPIFITMSSNVFSPFLNKRLPLLFIFINKTHVTSPYILELN